jgi:SAM-dependent methyltransferase
MDAYLEANRALWEEWTDIHETSAFYDLDAFRKGGTRLQGYEIEEIGDVTGKTLLHLQCHFGMDSLSWARRGADVTGADFSPKAVALAAELAGELGLADRARFVCSNLYDLPANLQGGFDVVYTSRGVLGWLPDIEGWARIAAHFVRPGGIFYITEIHPVAQVWDDEDVEPGELRLRYPYFSNELPFVFPTQGSYADRTARVEQPVEYGWNHGLGEIVTALAANGLRVESLREFPHVDWPLPFLERAEGGRYRLPALPEGEHCRPELPLFFSLKATKPARSED